MQLINLLSRRAFALLACLSISLSRHVVRAKMTTVYWPIQPYIYTDPKTGLLTGMYVETFKRAAQYSCNITSLDHHMDFQEITLLDMHQNLFNYSSPNNSLFPVFYSDRFDPTVFTHYGVFVSESVSVIMRRQHVEYSAKFFSSMLWSRTFLFLTALLILTVAIIIFLVERFGAKSESQAGVIKTIGSNCWFLVVTLTSVGYGDIVPGRFFTRILTVFVMISGLIVASILTAVVSEFITSNKNSIFGQQVGAIKGSDESKKAKTEFLAVVTEYDTFEDLYRGIRKNEVMYGILNTDIAAYQQTTWNDGYSNSEALVVTNTISMEVSVFEVSLNTNDYDHCLTKSYVAAKEEAGKIFRKKIKVTDYYQVPLENLFSEPSLYFFLMFMACCLVGIGIIYDVITYFRNKGKPTKKKATVEPGYEDWKQQKGDDDEDTVKVPRRVLVQLQEEVSSLQRIITNVTETIERNNRK